MFACFLYAQAFRGPGRDCGASDGSAPSPPPGQRGPAGGRWVLLPRRACVGTCVLFLPRLKLNFTWLEYRGLVLFGYSIDDLFYSVTVYRVCFTWF